VPVEPAVTSGATTDGSSRCASARRAADHGLGGNPPPSSLL